MINKSVFNIGVRYKKEDELNQNIKTDILIVGCGITGITSSYFLKDSNYKITIIEEENIKNNNDSKSFGLLTYLQGNLLNNIKNYHNKNILKIYINSQKEAMEIIKDIIIENNIKCDFESNNSYNYIFNKNIIQGIENIKSILNYNNIKYKTLSSIPLKNYCNSSIKVSDSIVINPFKYLIEMKKVLKNNISIFENTKIENIQKKDNYYICKCNTNKIIRTKKIIFTYFNDFINNMILFKINSYKNFYYSYEVDRNKRFNTICIDNNILTRFYSNSKNYIIYSNIKNEENIPNIKYYWHNINESSIDFLPLIGKINDENIYIGCGFNGNNITNGILSGKIISDLILNIENSYVNIFDPNRFTNKVL